MPKSPPTKNISGVRCLGANYEAGDHVKIRMLNWPDVGVSCEGCNATNKSDEFLFGIYRGHTIRHGSRVDVIEGHTPWRCQTCDAESKFSFFLCAEEADRWNLFFGLTEDGKIKEQVGDA